MMQLDKVLYTAKAHTTGGREGGHARTSDRRLEVRLTLPGGKDEGTNPEQLFAVGWSACYLSAIRIVAAKQRVPLPPEVAIDMEVDLGLAQGLHALAARLNVTLPGLALETAQRLADAAHQICPYARATNGNIQVTTRVFNQAASMTEAGWMS